jgi:hypothetical protein
MKQVTCATPREWRAWLRQNHGREDGVWLVFYKKATGKQSLDYDSALDEALCFGRFRPGSGPVALRCLSGLFEVCSSHSDLDVFPQRFLDIGGKM